MAQSPLQVENPEMLDVYFKATIENLEDVLGEVKVIPDEPLKLADVNFYLKKALVEQLVNGVEGDMAELYDMQNTDIHRLAYILLPRIKLINHLRKKIATLERVRNDPDYQRCIFQLNNTLGYLIQEAEPMMEQYTSMTQLSGLGGLTGVPQLPGMYHFGGGDEGTTTPGEETTDGEGTSTPGEETTDEEMEGGKTKKKGRKRKRKRRVGSSPRLGARVGSAPPKRRRRRQSVSNRFGI